MIFTLMIMLMTALYAYPMILPPPEDVTVDMINNLPPGTLTPDFISQLPDGYLDRLSPEVKQAYSSKDGGYYTNLKEASILSQINPEKTETNQESTKQQIESIIKSIPSKQPENKPKPKPTSTPNFNQGQVSESSSSKIDALSLMILIPISIFYLI